MLALPLALVLAACLAPIGQARSSGEGSQQEGGAPASQRSVEREERAAARRALREAKNAARRARQREERSQTRGKAFSTERDNGVVTFSCSQVTVAYRNFPDLPRNSLIELVKIDKVMRPATTFGFDGSQATHAIAIATPPGEYQIDLYSKWNTNGQKGAFDVHSKVKCTGVAFAIEKLQRIAGSSGSYTAAPLTGHVGQTVDYEIVVKNTGYLPLTFGDFTDPHCDAGTIARGPVSDPVPSAGSTTYTCRHLLTPADGAVGSYSNTATVRGTPPAGEGTPVSHSSNTVLVTVLTTPPEEETTPPEEKTTPPEEKHTPPGGKEEQGKTPTGGTLGSSASSPLGPVPPQSGALAFSARTVPALRGPQGCVRGRFTVSMHSTGVRSVTFYLDGHKLKTLTARNARRGLLAITIDATRLKLGAHRVLAKITMAPAASAAKSVRASRTLTVVRCGSSILTPKFTG